MKKPHPESSSIIDPTNATIRRSLRSVGPVLALVGLTFLLVGLGSFFSSFGSFEPPRYFWCAFVGMPLLALGISLTSYGFLGRFTRYVAGEVAPVQKDAFNYLAEGTSPGVSSLARAVGEGFTAGTREREGKSCPSCEADVPPGARFCPRCGRSFASELCAKCGAQSIPGAKFCHGCGASLRTSEIA